MSMFDLKFPGQPYSPGYADNEPPEPYSEPLTCDREGCPNTECNVYTYPVPVDGKTIQEFLCDEHASEAGFCPGCGWFGLGSDEYDFSPVKGWCSQCVDELDDGEYFDDE